MGGPGLLSLAAWSFYVLVLAVQPHQAHSSIRGSFGLNKGAVASPENGLCASSVTVHGYKCEEHEVTTKDGYILSVQRIPEGRVGGTAGTKKQPVLIQHGLIADGMSWFLNSPEQNLPLILADKGFDVWISNNRGTRLSQRHVSLDPSQPAYWNWSWDELVSFELPALFDYVYGQTGQKIDYVGHSLGTLTALASFSEGKLVNQLKSAALLSPIAYLSYMKTALGVVAAKSFVGEIGTLFGLAEFNPKGKAGGDFIKFLCDNPGVDCSDLVTAITGKNCCLNSSTVDLLLTNVTQPTSTMTMVHLSQTVRDGVVAKFNYGRLDYNLKHYGQAIPPIYNLSNIPHDLPLFLSYGGQDALSDVLDVKHLLDDLKSHDVDKLSVQFIKDYAHVDFIMGVNAKDVVYNQVVKFFRGQH
ncbi:hypothetical protein CMV_026409 [Castanea mollissima]|uniref:Lipase n=1 Tax=Castanea mollissima TaxID=60419 RepID=A0A8J4VAF4_9ROSI|nr:hypothetical protein CMV_026409 [Castanea mollissima]